MIDEEDDDEFLKDLEEEPEADDEGDDSWLDDVSDNNMKSKSCSSRATQ